MRSYRELEDRYFLWHRPFRREEQNRFYAGYKPTTGYRRVANPPERGCLRGRYVEHSWEVRGMYREVSTNDSKQAPTLRRGCNPPPTVAGSATQ